jgi:beta-lactamase superfamily II metal-dependent hydrolase
MLKIHFINVGKGNCTVIDFPSGHLTVIDMDNSRWSEENDLTDPIDFLKEKYPNRNIFRLIITHPDMDHLSGMQELDENRTIINFWDTENNKVLSQKELDESPYEANDWKTYQKYRKSSSNPKCLNVYRNESKDIWNTDDIQILSPSKMS